MEHLSVEVGVWLFGAWLLGVILLGGCALSYAFWRILRDEKALGPIEEADFEEEHQP